MNSKKISKRVFGGHPTENASNSVELRSLLAALRVLYRHLSPARRRAVLPLIALMLSGAFAELLTLSALLPFLAAISMPENSPLPEMMQSKLAVLGTNSPQLIIHILAGLFALAALCATAIRLILLRVSQGFVFGMSYEMGVKLYGDTLRQPYSYHVKHNSSEIIASLNKIEIVTNWVLQPLMTSIVALIITAAIISWLIIIDPSIALVSGVGFIVVYAITSFATRSGLKRNSKIIADAQSRRIRVMQEGLGGIRDVLIDNSQQVFIQYYENAEAGFRDARLRNALFSNAPRFVVEGVGMVLLVIVAVSVSGRPGGVASAIPILGALALGAQKLLPLIQQIYMGWASATGNRQALFDIVGLMSRAIPNQPSAVLPLPFKKKIVLDNVSYTYLPGRSPVLNGISLEIPKGARVGIIGKSGSGKTTLLDLVIGLLEPSLGQMLVDGTIITGANRLAWQRNIAHVPQSIFLADASVAENIAFGVNKAEIDMERVRHAAEKAELTSVIQSLPLTYDTPVGERGIQLSGGQRQRIGIARALYKNASVLVFDEATSALDNDTESAVMDAIRCLDNNLTIFMIAHRLSTLECCDIILRLEERKLASLKA